MKAVLDTSAFIYLTDFRMFDEIITVMDVVDEIKDKINSLKLSGIKLTILDPKESSIKEIVKISKETGDFGKLSDTDIKILALAKENNSSIVSDDYAIQNVAEKLGLEYVSLFNKKITKQFQWKNYCQNCKKFYENDGKCPKCGGKLTRKAIDEKFISRKSN